MSSRRSVLSYIAKRLLWLIPTLLLVITMGFVLVRLLPGGPFDEERAVPAEIQKALNAKYHLDDPIWKQYLDWLWAFLSRGDLGPTFRYPNRSVSEIIGMSLPISMQLGSMAMILALIAGLGLGMLGAAKQNTWMDTASTAASLLLISLPRFVLAPLLILIFSLQLYWLPVARWESPRHMVLPVICAAAPAAATIARLFRSGMIEILRSDFIRTAKAKGLPRNHILFRHAWKGAMLPVLSYIGPGLSHLLVGSIVIERIFHIPGMGRYFVEAALNRDYNLLLGVMLVYGIILMVINTIVDIAYAYLDPRVELG